MKMYVVSSESCIVFGTPIPAALKRARERQLTVKTDKPISKYARTNVRADWARSSSPNPRNW
jgi:hypothetical protein